MHNNAHRFSIEWARIEPEQGKFDQKEIEHYRGVILALKQRNLEPFVTLYHWTLPVWFVEKGGWLNKDAPAYFERFVEKIVDEYKDLVKFWITLNEPDVYVSNCFLEGDWPPFKKNWFKARKVFSQLVKAHKKTYQIIHRISSNSRVGTATEKTHYKGVLSFLKNYDWDRKFSEVIKDYQDFVGLNYYFSHSLKSIFGRFNLLSEVKPPNITDVGWRIVPEGICHVLEDLKKYNKPIYILENGLADRNDENRAKFIIDHLKWVHKAIGEGIDVRGYFHWSLLDNFEWAMGFVPRFGLIEIDYKNNLKRISRPSSRVYAEICKNNGINV
jgi:beta-glucosidase